MIQLQKKLVSFFVLLTLVTAVFLPAAAWVPDDFYETIDGLPSSIHSQLPPEQGFLYGLRGENTVYVLTSINDNTKQIRIYEAASAQANPELSEFALTCTSSPLTKWRSSEAGIGCSGGGLLHLIYDGGGVYFNFAPNTEGRWILRTIQGMEMIGFSVLGMYELETKRGIYGKLEFDLATMDVSALPATFDEACMMIDTKGCAMVKSDVSTNLLYLRTAPSKNAASIGKYYGGTPVRVLSEEGAWCKVSVFGVEGYFIKESLAFDQEMVDVTRSFLDKVIRSECTEQGIPIYSQPDDAAKVIATLDESYEGQPRMIILGIVGNDWYHVLFTDGASGYIEAKYCYDGNG